MTTNELYYQPSGKMPIGGFVMTLLMALLASLAIAFAYVYAVWYIPFVYVSFVLTFLFGFGTGAVIALGIRTGKIRNKASAGLLCLFSILVAYYFHWVVYCSLAGHSGGISYYLSHPNSMSNVIGRVYDNGMWSLKGATVSGVFLGIIWFLEAAIIIACTFILPIGRVNKPFSENKNEWLTEREMAVKIKDLPRTKAELKASLESNASSVLDTLEMDPNQSAYPHLKVAYFLTDDLQEIYLSLSHVRMNTSGKKNEEKTEAVVEYLRISNSMYDGLRKKGLA
jgi:hypothetical protein